MILKELHLTDALGRISIFPPLTYNGEVRILTWPQVIDISKIRDIQIVGTSGLIKFWKLEKILLTRALLGLWIFHRLLGGGGGRLNAPPPPMISAPGRRREKRKAAFESSRKIISK